MNSKKCAACQADMDDDAIFCNECGLAQPVAEPATILQQPFAGQKDLHSSVLPSVQTVVPPPASQLTEHDNSQIPAEWTTAVKKRYCEGYLYANFLNGFGAFVIVAGIGVCVVAFFLAVSIGGAVEKAASNSFFGGPSSGTGFVLGVMIFSVGAFFGGIFFISGFLTRAAAQHLKASFDGAVNGSPFLSNSDRAEMMSLR